MGLDLGQAQQIQKEIATAVVAQDRFSGPVQSIAGADVAYDEKQGIQLGVFVTVDAITFDTLEVTAAESPIDFPYIPGYFSFREIPALLAAYKKVQVKPDLIVCDGQGLAHPRRCGMASHLGVLLNVPTIGVGKTRLTGDYQPVGPKRGDSSPLLDGGETIGQVLRTQDNVKPVFVSIGHMVSLATASDWILRLAHRYRQPEVIRRSDHVTKEWAADRRKLGSV